MRRLRGLLVLTLAALLVGAWPTPGWAEVSYAGLDSFLRAEFAAAHTPGAGVQVVGRDGVLFEQTYGTEGMPLDAPLGIGSLSKSFTAVAITQLAERGQLRLDGYLADYLPGIAVGDQITIRQLLHHTSGLQDYQSTDHLTINGTPGVHKYAGVNYALLGEVVAAVSGLDYGTYLHDNVLAPLGLRHTFASRREALADGLLLGHRNYFGFPIVEDIGEPEGHGYTSAAEGYLMSSVTDMGTYLRLFLGGGPPVISRASVETILTDTVPASATGRYGYGWFALSGYREPAWEHSGTAEAYQSEMFILPESGIGVVILINNADFLVGQRMMSRLFHGVLQDFAGERQLTSPRAGYWTQHIVVDVALLLLLATVVVPLARVRRWTKKVRERGSRRAWTIVWLTWWHVAWPTGLLLSPLVIGYPYFVLRGFSPDSFLVLVTTTGVAYATGVLKLVLWWRCTTPTRGTGL
ncbi:MAG: beta-lactamase family protein [Propionibacteriaceae bacterium]|jgi:CubicO group peptidase (beta-lactamase class C family)|nr:beta-lactamase family protein [Propionibacteriaceae bacterium]